jgi:hypothetical protein
LLGPAEFYAKQNVKENNICKMKMEMECGEEEVAFNLIVNLSPEEN